MLSKKSCSIPKTFYYSVICLPIEGKRGASKVIANRHNSVLGFSGDVS